MMSRTQRGTPWVRPLAVITALAMALVGATPAPSAEAATSDQLDSGWHEPLDTWTPGAGFLAINCGYSGYGTYINRDLDGDEIAETPMYHLADDLGAPDGADVYAVADGEVIAEMDWGTDWGYAYFIQHEAGDGTDVVVLYGHVENDLNVGDDVVAGNKIADVWSDHLHLGVRPGTSYPTTDQGMKPCSDWPIENSPDKNGFVDPFPWMAAHPADESGAPIGGGGPASPDYNGDGYDDLAIGVPGQTINGNDDAGKVAVIYGSSWGLSATRAHSDQSWHENSGDINGTAEAGDQFGTALG